MGKGLRIRAGQISVGGAGRGFSVRIDALDLDPGQVVALAGESGSGKTLVLELLGLLRRPGDGTGYYHDGTDLAALWADGPRNAGLARARGRLFGFVPQSGGLVPFLTVAENIALPQRLTDRHDAAWCADLIDRLDLAPVATRYPAALSIGQRQRAAIARALSHRPPFVIADEPTAALDPQRADAVLELLLGAAREQGSGVILSSHDAARMDRFGIARIGMQVDEGLAVLCAVEAAPC